MLYAQKIQGNLGFGSFPLMELQESLNAIIKKKTMLQNFFNLLTKLKKNL